MTAEDLNGAACLVGLCLLIALPLSAYIFNSRNLVKLQRFKRDALAGLLDDWFSEIAEADYQNEAEVDALFVARLLFFLGIKTDDIRYQLTTKIQAGRSVHNVRPDWVVYRRGEPFCVVETKAQYIAISDKEIEQAKSYSQALNTPYFLTTNGREITLFERGVQSDRSLVSCEVKHLKSNWKKFDKVLGVGS